MPPDDLLRRSRTRALSNVRLFLSLVPAIILEGNRRETERGRRLGDDRMGKLRFVSHQSLLILTTLQSETGLTAR